MDIIQFAGMLYRTPVLLRTRGNFLHIVDQANEVAAVNTIEFFDDIQITERMTVDDNIVATPHQWDLIDPETNRMVDRNRQIEQ